VRDLSDPQVLVVDDDKGVRQMMAMFLEDGGYSVVEAEDGVEALRILRASPGRLVVLLDWKMPQMSGEEVLQAVKEDSHLLTRHAFVLVTANTPARSPHLLDLLDALCVAVLPKPFRLQHLLDTVDECAQRIHADGARS
jgi:CheY-like chemotaxis protein